MHHHLDFMSRCLGSVPGVSILSPHCQQNLASDRWDRTPHFSQIRFKSVNERSLVCDSSMKASANDPSWTGMIVTPRMIAKHTTNLPSGVTGAISPKPTVVKVVRPKYMAEKKSGISGFTPLSVT
mmetsp:Transcript_5484/g.7645  ORF Transcript_5484/g.7645 Transcript_5484/m.7645 type:complete len:125 (+) Transcript_5484:196-570(+)